MILAACYRVVFFAIARNITSFNLRRPLRGGVCVVLLFWLLPTRPGAGTDAPFCPFSSPFLQTLFDLVIHLQESRSTCEL